MRHRSLFAAVAVVAAAVLVLPAGWGGRGPDVAVTVADIAWSPGVPVNRADLCELVGTQAVASLGERYGYVVEPPEVEMRNGTCAHRLQRMRGAVRKESILVLASADHWNDPGEARRAFGARSDPASPDFELGVLFPESAVRWDIDSAWDEGVLVSDPTWENRAEFQVLVRRGGTILRYNIQLFVKGSTEDCSASVTENCVISPGIVSEWIATVLLPSAYEKFANAGII